MTNNKLCPEFPYFGAKYPDARCIDGKLWDMDKCDGQGNLYSNDEEHPPCPFCNTDAFIDYHTAISDEEKESMKYDTNLSEKDIEDILETNMTKEDATKYAESLKLKYLKTEKDGNEI